MNEIYKILIVNPGSTSTKIAIFDSKQPIFEEIIRHPSEELVQYETMSDQHEFRKDIIIDVLNKNKINLKEFSAIVGRGGLLKPIEGGTYLVEEKMTEDLKLGLYGEHACNLGGIIAYEIAKDLNIPAYIVDPVVIDELEDIARVSGIPQLERKSIFHALNQKAVARRAAKEIGKEYTDINVIVAHLGGGITVGAHKAGKVIDVNDGLDGDGPLTPERSGSLPTGQLLRLCFSGEYSYEDIYKLVKGQGGLVGYLGTNDGREVIKRIEQGDKKAEFIYKAMAYQVSKEIGAYATVLKGEVDAIILTGGTAYDKNFVSWVKERVGFISKVLVYPGEDEMLALAEGGLRVLRKEEEAKRYI